MKTEKNTNPKSFLDKSKGMPLEQADREFLASLRQKLVLHMKMNPVEPEAEVLKSPFVFALGGYLMAPALAVLIFILVASGTAFASQNALPGDLLYPVKILSEEITVAASFTPETRSKVRLSIAGRRVKEASKLSEINANEPKEDDEKFHASMQTVIANFDAQISANLDEGRKLRERDDDERAARIANDIEVATDSFNIILVETKGKRRDKSDKDVDQFINSNNDFSARAESESSNSGSGKGDSSDRSEDKSDDRNSSDDDKSDDRKGRDEREKNGNERRDEFNLNSSPFVPAVSAPATIKPESNDSSSDEQKKPDSLNKSDKSLETGNSRGNGEDSPKEKDRDNDSSGKNKNSDSGENSNSGRDGSEASGGKEDKGD